MLKFFSKIRKKLENSMNAYKVCKSNSKWIKRIVFKNYDLFILLIRQVRDSLDQKA